MPQNTTLGAAHSDWIELTNANVTNITFQNKTSDRVTRLYIAATTGATPSNSDAALIYGPGEGEVNVALSDLFPGVTGANRVFARGIRGHVPVFVSHA